MMDSTLIIDIVLMAMLVVVAFAIVRLRSLFAVVMLQGVYSLLSAAWFVSLDAVDVAFTEAAVGAGISTVLMLGAMLLTSREEKPVPARRRYGPLLIVIAAGSALLYAVSDMPDYGDPDSPANSYVGMDYIERTQEDIDIPNIVTAVLASYRGFDTLGETVVIFTAGLGVILLLGLNGNAGGWTPSGRVFNSGRPLEPSPSETPPAQPKPKSRRKTATAKRAAPKKTGATGKAPAKKPAAKSKTTAKKTAAKKAAPKKTGAKAPAKKTAAKKKPAPKTTGGGQS